MKQRLKKLEILGFKSFADKTAVEFSPGITGIVGPNGCGKSNIADAFRWVLGEQSAKSMRGSKMPDVIFSGTSTRSPLNIAEVTITLSNEDGMLPVDYHEIAITRRLHRSGESDYFLNRNAVRLKDLQDLFLDAGMGKNAFAIFEQGKIDQVIQYSPLERRYIFEDAAGILRFLQRKREALRKLEQVDQNTTRAKDIYQEVEKQIASLEEQAAKARIFKQNKAKFELFDKALLAMKWENTQQKQKEAVAKEAQSKLQHEVAAKQLEQIELKLKDCKSELEKSEKAFLSKNEEFFQAKSSKEIQTREKQTQSERLKETFAKEKRWKQELEGMIAKSHSRKLERAEAEKQRDQLEISVKEFHKGLQEQRQNTQSIEETVSTLREQLQLTQQERLKLLQSENHLESEIKQNRIRQDTLQEKQETLLSRKQQLITLLEELKKQVQEKKRLMQEASKNVDNQKGLSAKLDIQLQEKTAAIQATKHSLEALQQDIAEAKARHKVLIRLREEKEGFSAGSKRLLQEASNAKSPLYGMLKGLYEFIVPHAGAEEALAGTLRFYAQTLVVETLEQLNTVIAFAKKQQLKDFSLLCLETLPSKNRKESKTSSLLRKAVEHPLANHFLVNTYLSESFEELLEMMKTDPNASGWVSEGLFIDSKGVLFHALPSENNVFVREAELKSLVIKLADLEVEFQKANHTIKQQQTEFESIKNESFSLDKLIRKEEMTLLEINFDLQRSSKDLNKSTSEESQLETDLQNLKVTLSRLVEAHETLTQQYSTARSKGVLLQEKNDQLKTELDDQMVTLKVKRELLSERETVYRKTADDHKKVLHSLHIIEIHDIEGQQQEKRLSEEIRLSAELQTQIKEKDSVVETNIKQIDISLENLFAACREIENQVTKNKLAIEVEEKRSQESRKQIVKFEEELYRINLVITQLAGTSQEIGNTLQERYRMTLEEACAILLEESNLPKSVDSIEKQLRGLRHEMESAGDINMTSIEECDKHKVRYEFLNKQLTDLDGSRDELIQIITELDSESRKIFKDTFEVIRNNFKKNFKILFNGGEADLQFTEAADVLEAGIEIIAKPPGKQMRSISLMSGGEKCLTAMALLFAIFEVKPAPFCILDEIDAPLDDSNVERFVNVVKQFIDRCQFIIITHNKRTMSIADKLCGVSMQEKGVSKLLTIEFSQKPVMQLQGV